MTKTDILGHLYGLVADVNTEEIADQIKRDNLSMWCNSWRIATKEKIELVRQIFDGLEE